MDMWNPTCLLPYHYQYGTYDKMHYFRQAYQQHPVYRVPPVCHPTKTATTTEQHSYYTKSGVTSSSPHNHTAKPPLDESLSQRQRCHTSPEELMDTAGGEESKGRCCAPGIDEEVVGCFRRDSTTPDSTSSDQQDSRPYCRVLTFQDTNGQSREMVFPKALDLDRPKRARTSFTSYQLERLEREFNCNQYMVGRDRARLATKLDLTETQVKVWFQNRRTKFKKEQYRTAELQVKNAESIAACNILRLLQNQQADATITPSVSSISPIQSCRTSW